MLQMDQNAYDVFPSIQPSSKPKTPSNWCHLLGKDIGSRTEVADFCTCGRCRLLGSDHENICCFDTLDNQTIYSRNISCLLDGYSCVCDHPSVQSIIGNRLELQLFQKFGDYWKSKGGFFVDNQLAISDPNKY